MAAEVCERGAVKAVSVAAEAFALLPGAGFADAYRVAVSTVPTAPQVAEMVFAQSPAWVGWLMAVRDRMVAVFDLKQAGRGAFPILSRDDGCVVLGLDDSHLDFRLLVEVAPMGGGGAQITLTTLVRLNNLLGRLYLTAILPFHRMIARAMLVNLARHAAASP